LSISASHLDLLRVCKKKNDGQPHKQQGKK
jgi:hypothetical protein